MNDSEAVEVGLALEAERNLLVGLREFVVIHVWIGLANLLSSHGEGLFLRVSHGSGSIRATALQYSAWGTQTRQGHWSGRGRNCHRLTNGHRSPQE